MNQSNVATQPRSFFPLQKLEDRSFSKADFQLAEKNVSRNRASSFLLRASDTTRHFGILRLSAMASQASLNSRMGEGSGAFMLEAMLGSFPFWSGTVLGGAGGIFDQRASAAFFALSAKTLW